MSICLLAGYATVIGSGPCVCMCSFRDPPVPFQRAGVMPRESGYAGLLSGPLLVWQSRRPPCLVVVCSLTRPSRSSQLATAAVAKGRISGANMRDLTGRT